MRAFNGVMIRVVLLASIAVLLAALAYGQSSASITGVVRDASGAVVPRAIIVLHSSATGVSRQTLSNDTGNYAFVNVLPGTYTLTAEGPGFSKSTTNQFTSHYVDRLIVLNETYMGAFQRLQRYTRRIADVSPGGRHPDPRRGHYDRLSACWL